MESGIASGCKAAVAYTTSVYFFNKLQGIAIQITTEQCSSSWQANRVFNLAFIQGLFDFIQVEHHKSHMTVSTAMCWTIY